MRSIGFTDMAIPYASHIMTAMDKLMSKNDIITRIAKKKNREDQYSLYWMAYKYLNQSARLII